MRAAVLLALVACSKDPPPVDTDYCDRELTEMTAALEATLATPAESRGHAFAASTKKFTTATMCGPDMAHVIRDLRDHFQARGDDAQQRALLVRFADEATRAASTKWRMPVKLAAQIEQARR